MGNRSYRDRHASQQYDFMTQVECASIMDEGMPAQGRVLVIIQRHTNPGGGISGKEYASVMQDFPVLSREGINPFPTSKFYAGVIKQRRGGLEQLAVPDPNAETDF